MQFDDFLELQVFCPIVNILTKKLKKEILFITRSYMYIGNWLSVIYILKSNLVKSTGCYLYEVSVIRLSVFCYFLLFWRTCMWISKQSCWAHNTSVVSKAIDHFSFLFSPSVLFSRICINHSVRYHSVLFRTDCCRVYKIVFYLFYISTAQYNNKTSILKWICQNKTHKGKFPFVY